MDRGDNHSLEAQGGAAGSRGRCRDGGSVDRGDDREAGGKEKPGAAEGWRVRGAAGDLEIRGVGRATTD